MSATRSKRSNAEDSAPPIWDEAAAQAAPENGTGERATLLHTEGLKKVYDGRAVVNGVDIEVKAGEIVGIHVVDHIIVGDDRWTSLHDRGLIR